MFLPLHLVRSEFQRKISFLMMKMLKTIILCKTLLYVPIGLTEASVFILQNLAGLRKKPFALHVYSLSLSHTLYYVVGSIE